MAVFESWHLHEDKLGARWVTRIGYGCGHRGEVALSRAFTRGGEAGHVGMVAERMARDSAELCPRCYKEAKALCLNP